MKQTIIDSIPYESIAEVFPSASSQLPEEATQFMSTLASQTAWILCLVLLAVFVLALDFFGWTKTYFNLLRYRCAIMWRIFFGNRKIRYFIYGWYVQQSGISNCFKPV